MSEKEKSPTAEQSGKDKCVYCKGETPVRDHSILKDLCDSCIANAVVLADGLMKRESEFAKEFRHSPGMIREFGPWVRIKQTIAFDRPHRTDQAGKTGIVHEVVYNAVWPYTVRLDNNGNKWSFQDSHLEHLAWRWTCAMCGEASETACYSEKLRWVQTGVFTCVGCVSELRCLR